MGMDLDPETHMKPAMNPAVARANPITGASIMYRRMSPMLEKSFVREIGGRAVTPVSTAGVGGTQVNEEFSSASESEAHENHSRPEAGAKLARRYDLVQTSRTESRALSRV